MRAKREKRMIMRKKIMRISKRRRETRMSRRKEKRQGEGGKNGE